MLAIRSEQASALERSRHLRFIQTYSSLIREQIGDAGFPLSDSALEAECGRLLQRAHSLGLTLDVTIVSFIVFGIRGAPYFYLHPPFHRILTDPAIPEHRRAMHIIASANVQDWATAALLQEQ